MTSAAQPLTLRGPVGRVVQRNRAAVLAITSERGVTNVRVFGSVAKGEDTRQSDIDLLVTLPEDFGLIALSGMRMALQDLLHLPVDLVPEVSVKPRLADHILSEAVPL